MTHTSTYQSNPEVAALTKEALGISLANMLAVIAISKVIKRKLGADKSKVRKHFAQFVSATVARTVASTVNANYVKPRTDRITELTKPERSRTRATS